MLPIRIVAAGSLKEPYLREACREYEKRLRPMCGLSIHEIAEYRLPQNPSATQTVRALQEEAVVFRKNIPARAFTVALCIEGDSLDSPTFARTLDKASGAHPEAVFLIGSSYGLSDDLKRDVHLRLSLSAMTFPHQLTRVLLLEQIYRAGSILSGGKYHK